ncbi:MAG: ATP-grasp domain-containing protein, partial [Candidatus Binatia bacterium]
MNIHEFQAKEILKRFGVSVPRGIVVSTPEEAKKAADELGGGVCVVKAQIHAGGRGKGGGVKIVKSADQAAEATRAILGKNLV